MSQGARRALATVPAQPPLPRHARARLIGTCVLGAAVAAFTTLAVRRLTERRVAPSAAHDRAVRQLGVGASILSLSVLADSSLEHYRGAFENPAMYVAPLTASVMLANSVRLAARPERLGSAGTALCALAAATGMVGTGYHVYNIARREGGIDWLNLFYGAPLGAPFAVTLVGFAGLAASHLAAQPADRPRLLGRPAGMVLALGAAVFLFGTMAEAALLHFRGAYHNPVMYLPVSLPPLAASALAASVGTWGPRRAARRLLQATAAMGLAGVGFHAYGVSRSMGGFYNWSQNLLAGPPMPAPPSFTGIAVAGLAALDLMEKA